MIKITTPGNYVIEAERPSEAIQVLQELKQVTVEVHAEQPIQEISVSEIVCPECYTQGQIEIQGDSSGNVYADCVCGYTWPLAEL